MSNLPQDNFGRPKNDKKLKLIINDDENPLTLAPGDYTGNKFFGTWSKMMNMQSILFQEQREKFTSVYQAELKAELELQTIPECFNHCVQEFESGLNSREKNCMRDCYFKKVSSKDDLLNMLVQQKMAFENAKQMRERIV